MTRNIMSAMGSAGDTRVEWNPDNEDEVKVARGVFDDLTKQGFTGFRVYDDGKKGQQLTEFDPQAERILLIPPMAGG